MYNPPSPSLLLFQRSAFLSWWLCAHCFPNFFKNIFYPSSCPSLYFWHSFSADNYIQVSHTHKRFPQLIVTPWATTLPVSFTTIKILVKVSMLDAFTSTFKFTPQFFASDQQNQPPQSHQWPTSHIIFFINNRFLKEHLRTWENSHYIIKVFLIIKL